MDLRDASHEQAVEAIRRAGDTVVFLVQAGHHCSQVLHLRKMPGNGIFLSPKNSLCCVYAGMNTLNFAAFETLKAPDCLTLNLNTQQMQREGAVSILLDISIRPFNSAICGSL